MGEHQGDPLDLDLIRRVQQARMQHDAQATPSKAGGVYWVEARRRREGPGPTPRAGQWVISTTTEEVDALWAKIRAATEAGDLGYKAKVATAARDGRSRERMIHVVTYDADDGADVARVREALRKLGLDGRLRYERKTAAADEG